MKKVKKSWKNQNVKKKVKQKSQKSHGKLKESKKVKKSRKKVKKSKKVSYTYFAVNYPSVKITLENSSFILSFTNFSRVFNPPLFVAKLYKPTRLQGEFAIFIMTAICHKKNLKGILLITIKETRYRSCRFTA